MRVFGLTGGSGAGKSTAAEMLRQSGIYVIDADKVAREVVEAGKPCLDELKAEFGIGIIRSDGTLDRRALGKIVFSDTEKLKSLNKITHKYIKTAIVEKLSSSNAPVAAIDGAVIIGSEIEELCEFIVCVTADVEVRLERIMKRDGIDRRTALNRLKSQPDDNFYISHSAFVLHNNAGETELIEQVEELGRKIRENEV